MKYLRSLVAAAWWVAVGLLPVAQFRFIQRYSQAIGCPERGDCYVPGSEHLLSLDLIFFSSALLLWPACLWFLLVRPLVAVVRNARS